MICPNPECGRVYESVTGKCPHCSTKPQLAKRQKERPDPSGVYIGSDNDTCPDCGQLVPGTRLRTSSTFAESVGTEPSDGFYPLPHNCPKKATG
jgi:hypothetical protein